VSGDVGWRLLVTAQGHLPTHLCRAEYDRLMAGGVLGGDDARLLKHAFEEVTLFALLRALLVSTRQRAWVALVSLATNLCLAVPPLPPP
jgi:hypothetical protein